jgi:hypothetical protein
MKKQLKLFATLLTIAFSIFTIADKTLFPIAKATYIEGPIEQDTVWTLVDSPFVVSKDVIVNPNVTLTIEPEVEVKFGGNFSLTVEGRLVAEGTQDRMIAFSSNKDEPEAGDWRTIELRGTHTSSFLYCSIEYGTNGITVESGTVNIQNSWVSLNSENGIMIANGDVEVKNNEIINNTMSGITIAGGNRVIVQNNNVASNEDGITLSGNLTSEINIHQNEILLNRKSGIHLEANAYDNTVILNNQLSANLYGFHVSGNASTYITRNYISNNTVGILYEAGQDHTAYFNDIYGNSLGMDVTSSATVNAEHNYWGHESGPHHESLNPRGKGNPAGGDGVNLDFIFFLTATIDHDNEQPTAILRTDKTLVAPNQNVTLIGTDSHDDGHVDQYFFDFGDGTNSSWTTLSIFAHNYSSAGTYSTRLTVMDDFGVESDSPVTTINVQDLASLEASITPISTTVSSDGKIAVTAYVSDGTSKVENATVTLFSVKGGSFTPLSGLTNSTGHFAATFTAPPVAEVTNVRIVARASKAGYADGSDYAYLQVLPTLSVQITVEPDTIKSGDHANVTVHVTYSGQPISDANVKVSCGVNGNFSATSGITDTNGDAKSVFTAPPVNEQTNITITATVEKHGYAVYEGNATVTVSPRVFTVLVTATPSLIESEATSTITVYVTTDGKPVVNVSVSVTAETGVFSETTGLTDSTGYCTFIFTAPRATAALTITINAAATKNGYESGEHQTQITVNPPLGGGLPLLTILLILIPVIAIVVVAVLIKLKVISISWGEDE